MHHLLKCVVIFTASNDEVRSKDATNTVIHAQRVVVAEPYSNVIVQDTPSSTGSIIIVTHLSSCLYISPH